ncbi:anhydro-N-acetylmuramic acid kinase [Hyphomicrobium sp. LHD-15]|uniref:anhydro-N-acetylmuramic acid kinase n=1 Tax=Hyphomicrobium sp. LHD-15 TaxID=3072142 RepID=UPI00280D0850|nr:anhydro-N-acetylmuramic acid kinase [Hyphomicrobium sp. LHD-15]MDQ8697835.1 anhydro-N-acetylmuramic acid kinase [Hyphomicrobium sp. LHD-15]
MSKREGDIWRALGLMSGTSLDGIDVAVIETDGEQVFARAHAATYPYSEAFRDKLRAGLDDAAGLRNRDERPGRLKLIETYLTQLHAEAVLHYLADHEISPESIDLVGFHGQTVLHRPEAGLTVQLGDGPMLAHLIGRPVVYDLRAADMAAGGQGAPLAPAYHRALAGDVEERPVVVLNLGGVANVTWIGRDGTLIAFDTGPASALIDDWVKAKLGRPYDAGGESARNGAVHEEIVAAYLRHPYFAAPPPKSLDRNAFSLAPVGDLSPEDGAATLTAFTAAAIAASLAQLPEPPQLILAAGGGRRNDTLTAMIAERTGTPVRAAEAFGFDGDGVEAEAWAFLAVRSRLGLPITFPGTTGAPRPLTGGVLADAEANA